MSNFERELPPEELLKHPTWKTFKNFGVQWSQLIALFWCNAPSLTVEEKKLRATFIQLLQDQAKHTEVYVKCDAPDSEITLAEKAAMRIKNFLLGNEKVSEITLSDVLKKYTTQPLMTTDIEEVKKMFETLFTVRVITDSFVGKITYASGKDEISQANAVKYVLSLAYPPRPELSDATLTEQVLCDWANKTTDGSYEVPPSAYLPWSAS